MSGFVIRILYEDLENREAMDQILNRYVILEKAGEDINPNKGGWHSTAMAERTGR